MGGAPETAKKADNQKPPEKMNPSKCTSWARTPSCREINQNLSKKLDPSHLFWKAVQQKKKIKTC